MNPHTNEFWFTLDFNPLHFSPERKDPGEAKWCCHFASPGFFYLAILQQILVRNSPKIDVPIARSFL